MDTHTTVSLRVPNELLKRFDEFVQVKGVNRSRLIILAMEAALDTEDQWQDRARLQRIAERFA